MEATLGYAYNVVKEGIEFNCYKGNLFIEGRYEERLAERIDATNNGLPGIMIEYGENRLFIPSREYTHWFKSEVEGAYGREYIH